MLSQRFYNIIYSFIEATNFLQFLFMSFDLKNKSFHIKHEKYYMVRRWCNIFPCVVWIGIIISTMCYRNITQLQGINNKLAIAYLSGGTMYIALYFCQLMFAQEICRMANGFCFFMQHLHRKYFISEI